MNSLLTDLPNLAALSGLHFLRPLWFLALAPLPWLLWRLRRLDPGVAAWQGLVDAHLLPHLLVGADARIRRMPLVLLACGWLLGVTALAGPVWARLPQPLYQAQAQRVIVLDLSPEMDAQDLAPSRLGRARYEILDLLAAAAEGQTALLVYGAEPFLVSPLTGDAATIAAQVPDLATALLPVKGAKRTDLALAEAGELLKQAGSQEGNIILITADPERPEAVQSMAANLRDQGYRTSVLGLGTDQGAPVPLASGGFQSDDQGAIHLSRLRPEQLRAIAAAGGGRYVTLTADDADTRALLPEARRDAATIERNEAARADQWREEGPWVLVALLPLAAMAFRRGWLSPLTLLLSVCLGWVPPPAAQAFGWADLWWRPDQQGARALASGDPQQAAARFSRPDWRAAAQYQAGAYDQALATLEGQTGAEADYNRGNALARSGQLQEAFAAYEQTLAEAPGHADARFNRDLVQRLLAQQEAARTQEPSSSPPQEQGDDEGRKPSGSPSQQEPDDQQQQADESAANQQGQQDRDVQRGEEGQLAKEDHPDAGATTEGEREARQDQGGALERQPPQNPTVDQGGMAASDTRPPGEPAADQAGKADHDPRDQANPESTTPAATESTAEAAPGSPLGERSAAGQPPDLSPGDRQAGAEPGVADLLGNQGADPETDQPARGRPAGLNSAPLSEQQQALEAQLRRVPDDPGGLLRQRFLLQHLRRQGQLP